MSATTPEPGAPELLDSAADGDRPPRRRRTGLVVGVVVAVLVALGAGSWGLVSFLSGGGPAPATAIPATAVGYVSIDLDPSAAQKIEALRTLKRFPALAKSLNIGDRGDLKRWLFTQMQKSDGCKAVSYDKDVAPWIGNRVAVAGVPSGSDAVIPVVAVQVTDRSAARAGVRTLDSCDHDGDATGVAFVGDYMLLSDTQAHATKVATAATAASLQDDPTFQKWTSSVGGSGVLTAYVAPDAQRLLLDRAGNLPGGSKAQLLKAARDFTGGAAVLRFHGGTIEVESAFGGGAETAGGHHADVNGLPASTAAAFGAGLPDGWARAFLSRIRHAAGSNQAVDQMIAGIEAQTGLSIPGDVQAMLGNAVTVSVDSSVDLGALGPAGGKATDPASIPVGLRISGDPARIMPAVTKAERLLPPGEHLTVRRGDGVVAVGLDPSYVATLAGSGSLGSDPTFTSVVPHPDTDSAVLYVNFDSSHWLDRLVQSLPQGLSHGGSGVAANLAPLHALGLSTWTDRGTSHALFRLSTN